MLETEEIDIDEIYKDVHNKFANEENKTKSRIICYIDEMKERLNNLCNEEINRLKCKCLDFEELINSKGKSISLKCK
ncbi:MAG: hypothetical protein ACTSRP_10975 [Candidatus Helarchaeota archaeon]